jgi:hypothetical protein
MTPVAPHFIELPRISTIRATADNRDVAALIASDCPAIAQIR